MAHRKAPAKRPAKPAPKGRISLRDGIAAPTSTPVTRAEQRKFAQRNLQRLSTRETAVPEGYTPVDTQGALQDPEAQLYDTSYREARVTAAKQRMNAAHRPSGSEGAPPIHNPFAEGAPKRRAPLEPTLDTDPPDATDDEHDEPSEPEVEDYTGASDISPRSVTLHDIDRLWDWIREDPDAGRKFLGRDFDSSLALHTAVKDLYLAQHEGKAAIFAVDIAIGHRREHAGFVFLSPLNLTEQLAHVHLFFGPLLRGRIDTAAPALLDVASYAYPSVKLVVITDDPVAVRLYRRFGFTASSVLTREPHNGHGPGYGHTDRNDRGTGDRGTVRAAGAGDIELRGRASGPRPPDVDAD